MKQLISKLKGDKGYGHLTAHVFLFSFMPVFSASSNLAYLGPGTGNTLGYLVKHFAHICIGFVIIFHAVDCLSLFQGYFKWLLPVV
jgi:cell division protein FtsW